ncbi:heavy metal translocating P-type ATPase [Candidatus Phytoplasma pini]|uniref:P-type ATPase n=1 Tax=Candidatus Phytoplasma pini TaxID=267362 RepID=A0A559KJ52_9MOLU|nr:heavy metal translocating P-type ATPase [Candidatus Phytoplasma pini]TVY12161.1 P-type ATPase [Candidatus Phytoplasma pini]
MISNFYSKIKNKILKLIYLTNEKIKKCDKHILFFLIGVLFTLFFYVPLTFFNKEELSGLKIFKFILTLIILFLIGYHVILEGLVKTYQETRKNKKFTPNVHILMFLGALGSLYLKNPTESIILIFIFSLADLLEEKIENTSQKEIKKLLTMVPTKARLLKENGDFELVDVTSLKIGDEVLVLNGDKIPSDGIVISGNSSIDESSITGESVPLDKKVGDKVFGSNINLDNKLVVRITTTNDETVFYKIIKLTEKIKDNISKKTTFIKKIEPLYIKIIISIVLFILCVGVFNIISGKLLGKLLFQKCSFEDLFSKSMIFLTVASPCALVVSDIPATFSAVSNLAKKGILLKNGKTLGILSKTKAMVFDKTGTLTKGKMNVKEIFFNPEIEENNKYKYLNILFQMEQSSNHPLAFALQKYLKKNFVFEKILGLELSNCLGIGITAFDSRGNQYQVIKSSNYKEVSDEIHKKTQEFLNDNCTVVYFIHNNQVIMIISFFDFIREEALEMIDYLKYKKIKPILLTGDNFQTAKNVASILGISYFVADCFPETKVIYMKKIKKKYGFVTMVGDGINDAPVLANSDVSITLQEGTDIAIDIADIVLMKNDLRKIIYVHKFSSHLNKIVYQNIIFSICVILLLTIKNFININENNMSLTSAVSFHETSTILVILNSLSLLHYRFYYNLILKIIMFCFIIFSLVNPIYFFLNLNIFI